MIFAALPPELRRHYKIGGERATRFFLPIFSKIFCKSGFVVEMLRRLISDGAFCFFETVDSSLVDGGRAVRLYSASAP